MWPFKGKTADRLPWLKDYATAEEYSAAMDAAERRGFIAGNDTLMHWFGPHCRAMTPAERERLWDDNPFPPTPVANGSLWWKGGDEWGMSG